MYSEMEITTDPAEELKQKATELMQKPYHDQRGARYLSYAEAFKIVCEQHPELPRRVKEIRFAEHGY